jgi:hypothetical protein
MQTADSNKKLRGLCLTTKILILDLCKAKTIWDSCIVIVKDSII